MLYDDDQGAPDPVDLTDDDIWPERPRRPPTAAERTAVESVAEQHPDIAGDDGRILAVARRTLPGLTLGTVRSIMREWRHAKRSR